MIDVGLEPPEVDVGEDAPAFKRRLAIAVVLLTVLGAVVAYLQNVEGMLEDNAAGDAAREAVLGLGNQVAESADATADGDILTIDQQLAAQEATAQRQLERVGFEESQAAAAAAAARQAAAAQAAIAEHPALAESTEELETVERADDPLFARLSQAVSSDQANAHGSKADAYVAVLTVLAASLFLLGLSLTVTDSLRLFLVIPGIGLAAIGAVATVLVAQRDVVTVPNTAIELTAEAQRTELIDIEAAIELYEAAIEESEEFGPAYAGRAGAIFRADSPQLGEADVISITDPGTAEDVIEDLERAIDLGEDDNPDVLSFAGYMHAVYGDTGRGVALASEASDLSRDDPRIRFNRGVAEVAAGLDDEALRSYRAAEDDLGDEPVFAEVLGLLSGARSDLSALLDQRRNALDDDLLIDVSGRLADFETRFRLESGLLCDGCLEPGAGLDGQAGARGFEFSTDGFFARVDFDVTGVPTDSPVSIVWFTRQTGADAPFQQVAFPDTVDVRVATEGSIASLAKLRTEGCPEPAEVRVEVYAGDQLLGIAEGDIPPNPLGAELSPHVDAARGITICVPDTFEVVDREDLDGADFNTVEIDDTATGVSVFAFKAIGSDQSGLSLDARISLAEERLAAFAFGGELGPIEDTFLFAQSEDGREFLDGRSALITGTQENDGPTAVAVDANGVVYSVFIVGSEDPALLAAAIDLVEFTGLDADAAPD